MPIVFECTCGKKLQVPEAHAGKTGKCPACGSALLVPVPPPITLHDPAPVPDFVSSTEFAKSQRSLRRYRTSLIVCFVMLLFSFLANVATNWRIDRMGQVLMTSEVLISGNGPGGISLGVAENGPFIAFRGRGPALLPSLTSDRRMVLGVNRKDRPFIYMFHEPSDGSPSSARASLALTADDNSGYLMTFDRSGENTPPLLGSPGLNGVR